MKNLLTLTEDLVNKEKEFINNAMRNVDFTDVCEADAEEFELIKDAMRLLMAANTVIVEQAKMLMAMDEKLELLVQNTKKD